MPASREDLPDREGRDAMAKSNQLALHTPMPPTRVLGGHAKDKLLDCCCGGGTATAAARGVVPLPGNQPAVPGQDRGRSDRENPQPSGDVAPTRTRQPAIPGRQACNAPGKPVDATQRSRAARPAVRHPCSGLATSAPRSGRADRARAGTRSTVAAPNDHPRPRKTRDTQVRTLHRVTEPHRFRHLPVIMT